MRIISSTITFSFYCYFSSELSSSLKISASSCSTVKSSHDTIRHFFHSIWHCFCFIRHFISTIRHFINSIWHFNSVIEVNAYIIFSFYNKCIGSYYYCIFQILISVPVCYHPSATSRIIIKLNPTAKKTVPIFECCPCDISGISSSTTT